MNGEDAYNWIWGVVMLVILVSAISARRLSLGTIARGAIAWAAIGLIAYILVAHRYELKEIAGRVTAALGLDEQQVQGTTVRIRMSPDGHFWARVRVNGSERRMLVDSGATITAMSSETAAALNIAPDRNGLPVIIETANGAVEAQRGSIEELAVGGLVTRDLGVVISPSFGETDVLGMNFLSRLKSWRVEGNVLVLDPGSATSGAGNISDSTSIAREPNPRADFT